VICHFSFFIESEVVENGLMEMTDFGNDKWKIESK
jgi:hypothetical protein